MNRLPTNAEIDAFSTSLYKFLAPADLKLLSLDEMKFGLTYDYTRDILGMFPFFTPFVFDISPAPATDLEYFKFMQLFF